MMIGIRMLACALAFACGLSAEVRVEKNVVYGMYSGLALLMDIHYPEEPNGYGVLHIPGSGWSAPLSWDARQLKERQGARMKTFLDAGFTIFTINHRASPRFEYPAAVEDAQRAVRFMRFHANRFSIDAGRIGAVGWSSGGHLSNLLGTLDCDGDPSSDSEIERQPCNVQAVVAIGTLTDFGSAPPQEARAFFLGARLRAGMDPSLPEMRIARAASPLTYVSSDDAPVLFFHGDADQIVPFSQSEILRDALLEAGVDAELVRIKGGGHDLQILNAADFDRRAPAWFERHLALKAR